MSIRNPRAALLCRSAALILLGLSLAAAWPNGAFAQAPASKPKSTKSRSPKPKPPPPPTTTQLQRVIEEQRAQLEQQVARLAAADSNAIAQDSSIAALRSSIAKTLGAVPLRPRGQADMGLQNPERVAIMRWVKPLPGQTDGPAGSRSANRTEGGQLPAKEEA